MHRSRLPKFALATLLVLLLPLESAHCAFMGLQAHAACASSTAAAHSCCTPHGASHSAHPAAAPHGCACQLIPASTVPAAIAVEYRDIALACLQVPAVAQIIEPISRSSEEIVPALDAGSPPLPLVPGAHGLRAPPVSA